MLEEPRAKAKTRAKREAERQAEVAMTEFGRMAFDLLEEYFPEEAKARRRSNRAKLFIAGIAVGVLVYRLLSR